ncbi:hypothetical protein F2P56_014386 [Juglans regia]|uniref:AT-rich interactive domain-containing protein 1-like n=1 Tax=Juglans regia TaxID=51240 RepID=A0A833XDS9_JUGRE|nr:hypothetical protein F2P56_014386 [Juglans regia]
MDCQPGLKAITAKVPDKKKKNDEEYPHLESASEEVDSNGSEKCIGDEGLSALDLVGRIDDGDNFCNEVEGEVIVLNGDGNDVIDEKKTCLDSSESAANEQGGGNLCFNIVVNSLVAELDAGKGCDVDDDGAVVLDPENFCGKRKRESLCGMLNWVMGVAKNPCDPAVGSLPERSKWKSHGKEMMWKQVLLAREAIFLKMRVDSNADQWQRTQKMHPCMYDDQFGSNYNFRERSKRCKKRHSEKMMSQTQACSESPSATQSDLDKTSCTEGVENGINNQLLGTSDSFTEDSGLDKYVPKRKSWRPCYKAEVQDWNGVTSESDLKWLGTRVWPLEKVDQRYIIERDPIGKGRQDSCGCEVPASIECVRFHVAEKRLRVKRELGLAYYQWEFHKMGEEVQLLWTEEEQQKFKAILDSNRPTLQRCFWDQNFQCFPTRSRADLVSYYFNVFLLERRGYQNRLTPNIIDSDDEELESGLSANVSGHEADKLQTSIFYSPKKPHTNFR